MPHSAFGESMLTSNDQDGCLPVVLRALAAWLFAWRRVWFCVFEVVHAN